MRSIHSYLTVQALAIAGTLAAPCAWAQRIEVRGYDVARDVTVAARDGEPTAANARRTLTFSALGRRFALELEPNSRINAVALAAAAHGAVAYRGTLTNTPGSWARVVLGDTGPTGIFWDGQTLFGIESPDDTATDSTETAVFRADDILIPADTMSCGLNEAPLSGSQMLQAVVAEATTALATGAVLNLDIGAVADYEFTQLHSDPAAAMLTRLNIVDGIYSEQVGVQLSVQQIDVFDVEADDPFTDATNPSDLLAELGTYRGASPAQSGLGLTHMFTGRDLDGTTVGIAYLAALCGGRASSGVDFGSGLTESSARRGAVVESIVAAHEIGHNFGSPHDGDPDEACADEPSSGFIMASAVSFSNPPDQFSQCSLEQMQIEIAGARCLTAIDFADIGLSTRAPASELFTETQFQYVITATNQGGADAANAAVTLEFGTGLEVLSVTPASGSCGPAQSTVTCTLGTLPGSSARDITAELRTAAPGRYAIAASATADENTVASNDSVSGNVDIIAAVDLALVASSSMLEQDKTTIVQVNLDNLAGLAASGVHLVATASQSLQVGNVTLAGQACSVTGNTADCELAMLPAHGRVSLAAALTGDTPGAATLNLSAQSTEHDRNPGNNSASVALTVTDGSAGQQSGGGGGGSLGLLTLFGLAAAWGRRVRAR